MFRKNKERNLFICLSEFGFIRHLTETAERRTWDIFEKW